MNTTPVSLLERIRFGNNASAWERLVELYTPLLFHWARQQGLQLSDAADVVQDVLSILIQKLPTLEYDPTRSFHAWLKTVFLNRVRTLQRSQARQTCEPFPSDVVDPSIDQDGEAEYRQYLIRQAFRIIELEFSDLHRKVFRASVHDQKNPEDIAREFGVRIGTVYGIKSKILQRLRQELQYLVDDAD